MIPIPDPALLGRVLRQVREMLGMTRREFADKLAAATSRDSRSHATQLWNWETGALRPELTSLLPVFEALGVEMVLRFKNEGPRTWARLESPPPEVRQVRSESGTLWTRMDDEGSYWSSWGVNLGVSWAQVLRWGPVAEVRQDESPNADEPMKEGTA